MRVILFVSFLGPKYSNLLSLRRLVSSRSRCFDLTKYHLRSIQLHPDVVEILALYGYDRFLRPNIASFERVVSIHCYT